MFGLCYGVLSSFVIHIDEGDRAGALPHGAVGWSAVCDCGIS